MLKKTEFITTEYIWLWNSLFNISTLAETKSWFLLGSLGVVACVSVCATGAGIHSFTPTTLASREIEYSGIQMVGWCACVIAHLIACLWKFEKVDLNVEKCES